MQIKLWKIWNIGRFVLQSISLVSTLQKFQREFFGCINLDCSVSIKLQEKLYLKINMNINFDAIKSIKNIHEIFTQPFTPTGVKSYVPEDCQTNI